MGRILKRAAIIALAAAVGLGGLAYFALFGRQLIDVYDSHRTSDVTDLLLQKKEVELRAAFGGSLTCIFPPKDPALVVISQNLGDYKSNRFFDLMEADRWVIAALFPNTMRVELYSVNDNRIRFAESVRPCGENLLLRLSNGTPPGVIFENIQIENLGYSNTNSHQ